MSETNLTGRQRRRLRDELRRCTDVRVYRRVLAVLDVDAGAAVADAARRLNVSRQSVHQWLRDFRERRGSRTFEPRPRSGRPSLWQAPLSNLLDEWLRASPRDFGCFAAGWTVPLLREQFRLKAGVELSDDTIRRELRRRGLSWKRARYTLEPDPQREKKT